MTDYDNISYLGYLNKLVDEYNNSYYRSIDKKSVGADYSAFTEEIESIHKAPKLIESRLLSTRIFLAKVTPKIGQEKLILC